MRNGRMTFTQKINAFFQRFTSLFQPKPWHWILPIKGHFYYDAELAEAAGWLVIGQELRLSPESDNPYDSQAIQIYLPLAQGNPPALIGYIPYTHSRALTWLLNETHLTAPMTIKLFNGYRQYQRLHLFILIQTHLNLWQRLRLSLLKRPKHRSKNR
ncbi:hypothetical protein CYQ88_02490 [Hydrogenovibrio sp. SC-1]|uniref:HIRAN domain-containing protein n=1 Tax=Hydrogenovibrio sp. SC-1 TaxID=2065820 RepID=UPI000C7D06F0|nr:HIRAN domain-containing protein [Hydrogenovibrio sp. SC-1]PLA75113.1 hypothetical protein CYQ88_02490 [Hydrogenovibrio sp. SC-1]